MGASRWHRFGQLRVIDDVARCAVARAELDVPLPLARALMPRVPDVEHAGRASWGRVSEAELRALLESSEVPASEQADLLALLTGTGSLCLFYAEETATDGE